VELCVGCSSIILHLDCVVVFIYQGKEISCDSRELTSLDWDQVSLLIVFFIFAMSKSELAMFSFVMRG